MNSTCACVGPTTLGRTTLSRIKLSTKTLIAVYAISNHNDATTLSITTLIKTVEKNFSKMPNLVSLECTILAVIMLGVVAPSEQ